jgi:hypothetical protein
VGVLVGLLVATGVFVGVRGLAGNSLYRPSGRGGGRQRPEQGIVETAPELEKAIRQTAVCPFLILLNEVWRDGERGRRQLRQGLNTLHILCLTLRGR